MPAHPKLRDLTAMRIFLLLLIPLLSTRHCVAAGPDMAPVKQWIARQGELRSVSADLTQTRSLKALRSPLSSPGHLWFLAPDSFRWELGNPVKTIVLRRGDSFFVIQPGKKRAERHPVTQSGPPSAVQAMATMGFPFAKDYADFQRQFETLGLKVEGPQGHLEVAPRDPQMRKMLSSLDVDFDTNSGIILSFALNTRDGSTLRNEFSNVQVNPKLERHLFEFDFTGYEVTNAR